MIFGWFPEYDKSLKNEEKSLLTDEEDNIKYVIIIMHDFMSCQIQTFLVRFVYTYRRSIYQRCANTVCMCKWISFLFNCNWIIERMFVFVNIILQTYVLFLFCSFYSNWGNSILCIIFLSLTTPSNINVPKKLLFW